ncbi:MAG: pyruvate, phosphate dikinase/phosphoenolpyruvate synthase regulator [Betaproteobacteria bacterium]|nr:pyruvate, phosphate dikinase/phosphoenolpyruvate synthase regulator [Betaproteobacteria bacterium]
MQTSARAHRRTAYFVSDRTGITCEMLGHSLLTQFEGVQFTEITKPFIDSIDKAAALVHEINQAAERDGARGLVFCTLVNADIEEALIGANALVIDCFQFFIAILEQELGLGSARVVGRSHSADNLGDYHRRIEAVNFALSHDDGISTRDLGEADIVLVGVSRSGKTPTCLYMALQYGIRTANYPLVAEDFQRNALPPQLHNLRRKLYGLTIQPERLQVVRNERRPGSRYSTLANCQFEVRAAEALMRQEGVPYIDTSRKSIEEIAATILHDTRLVRHVY